MTEPMTLREELTAFLDRRHKLGVESASISAGHIVSVFCNRVKAIENQHATPGCFPSAYSGFEECRQAVLKMLEEIEVKNGACQTRIAELEQELAVGNALTAKLTDQCRELENKLEVMLQSGFRRVLPK